MITANQLRVMPLHAITEILGTGGLQQRLVLELDRLPAATRTAVTDAAAWAGRLHESQHRVREPYINHPLRVALRILCYYRVHDPDVLTAALLHDTVEDQPWAVAARCGAGPPPREAAFAALTDRYSARVRALVAAVTNPITTPGTDRTQSYLRHLSTAVAAEPWARVIKLSDFTDNAAGLIHTPGPKAQRAAVKYGPAVAVMRDLLHRPDTPLAPAVKAYIDTKLDVAQGRIAAIAAA
ncbi:HD domain-containing protein [Symbioplanes lichenis]|uniref:HD domain-containing protein n=1 Tax=Symbioplanes lichenis TaxID=1629072 RepID=UPI0027397260|nr:HD domain-containing protein [Actinoplanes lichenis]